MHQIRPGLFLGCQDNEQGHLSWLTKHSITHVLQVGPAYMQPTHPGKLVYKHIEAGDCSKDDLVKKLIDQDAFEFIHQGTKTSGVLVHCQVGVSRSATAVIAYLMTRVQDTPNLLGALADVIKCRPYVQPNPGFCRQLKALEACKGDTAKYRREDGATFVTTKEQYLQFFSQAQDLAGRIYRYIPKWR